MRHLMVYRNNRHFRRIGLILLVFLFPVSMALPDRQNVPESSVTSREKQIADRFWEILVRSPRRGATFDRVYGFYVDSGYGDLLLKKCRDLTEHSAEAAEARAWLLLGLLWERRGETNQAVDAFDKAARLDPDDALAPFYRAESLASLGKLREALDALESSLRRKPGRADLPSVLLAMGRLAEKSGESEKARQAWSQLETLFPDNPEMSLKIAETLESDGHLDEALEKYRSLVRFGLKSGAGDLYAATRFALAEADILLRQGKEREALRNYTTLLDRLSPNHWIAETVLDRIEQTFENLEDAHGLSEFYRRHVEKHPNDIESTCRLARVFVRLKQENEARILLEKAVERFPAETRIRSALIDRLIAEDRIADALKQFQLAADQSTDRLSPWDGDLIVSWGRLALRNPARNETERKADAVAVWKRLLTDHPDDPATILRVADLAAQYDISSEAEKLYQRIIELRPEHLEYREYLGLFYHRRQEKEKAVAMLRSMSQGSFQNNENLLYSGSILQSLGYRDEALRQFQIAVESESNDLQARWKYTEALILCDAPDEALKQLIVMDRVIENDDQFDSFLQREVRFLQETQSLDTMAQRLDAEIKTVTDSISERLRIRRLWRLAIYRQAQGETNAATEIMEQALRSGRPSNRLFQSAAELFEQSGQAARSMEIYRQLVEEDGVWRVGNLKRLALLETAAGQLDRAVESGRRLMELGSGNAANVRFFGELLLKADRRNEAIDVFRQALRIEPGDTGTLRLLAETLAGAGREPEAIEIAWRLFQRKEDIHGKMDSLPMLVELYRKTNGLEKLLQRLRIGIGNDETRRDSMICLAKVYRIVDDDASARQILEQLRTFSGSIDEKTGSADLLLLEQLVETAQRQGDYSSAVRYQEQLCRRRKTFDSLDKLFVLYDLNGDTKKAVELFLGGVLLKTNLKDQLESIDRMIRREQYEAVDRVLAFLEIHDAVNWQVPYRRLALSCYEKEGDVDEQVEDFRRLSFSREKELKESPENLTRTDPSDNELRSGPWLLPGNTNEIAPENREFLPTLFRDRLVRNERYQTPNNTEPPKPFYDVRDFSEARFLSLAWMLKEALDRDRQASETAKRDHFEQAVDRIRGELSDGSPERIRFERLAADMIRIVETDITQD